MNTQTPDIVGALGKKSQYASISKGDTAGGLSRAAGMDVGKNGFAQQLNTQMMVKQTADSHAKAQEAAQGLVSNALILPILQQVRRDSEQEKGVFSGGNGEKMFGPQFDMQIADRIARSPQLGITQSLTSRLEKRSANAKSGSNTRSAATLDVHG